MKIPAGVTASTATYDQGGLPSLYHEPAKWRPDRLLEATDDMPFRSRCPRMPGLEFGHDRIKVHDRGYNSTLSRGASEAT